MRLLCLGYSVCALHKIPMSNDHDKPFTFILIHYQSLSFIIIHYHSLSFIVIHCHYHSLSLSFIIIIIWYIIHYNSLFTYINSSNMFKPFQTFDFSSFHLRSPCIDGHRLPCLAATAHVLFDPLGHWFDVDRFCSWLHYEPCGEASSAGKTLHIDPHWSTVLHIAHLNKISTVGTAKSRNE